MRIGCVPFGGVPRKEAGAEWRVPDVGPPHDWRQVLVILVG
jgi:hypothetical protein